MLNKRKPKLTWAPSPSGRSTSVERLMMGPWELAEVYSMGDYGYGVRMSLPINKDATGNRIFTPIPHGFKPLEKAKEQAEKYVLSFLAAVGLEAVVAFPDKTVRAPKPTLAPTGIRRLEV